jgi:hypothetical protein
MLLASITGALSTLFAAVAAIAALGVILQARVLHSEDAADRARERTERRREFDHEAAERRRVYEAELRLRQLEQLGRISDLVAAVRQTARDEADLNDDGRIAQNTHAPFFWNVRKQLELGLNILEALSGPDTPACRNLATSHTMGFLSAVVAGATDAFDELARAATAIGDIEARARAEAGSDEPGTNV